MAHESRFVRVVNNQVRVELMPFSIGIDEVTVSERGAPYFKMANHVLDFEFYDDLILLLGNSGREVRLIDHRGNVVDRSLTPGKFSEIFKDCLNNLHLVGKDTAWQVYYDYEKIHFIHPHERPILNILGQCESRYKNGLIYSMGRRSGLVTTFLFAAGGATMPFYEVGDTSRQQYLDEEFDLSIFLDKRNSGDSRYATSVAEIRKNLRQLQSELAFDWIDSRILHPSAYYVFPVRHELRVFSLGIMTEFRFKDLQSDPDREIIKLPREHLDFMTRDEASQQIYAVYRSGMGKVWAVPINRPQEELVIGEFAFPSSIKLRDNHSSINDPAIDGSNYLYEKTYYGSSHPTVFRLAGQSLF
ncbi:MAG: hypothetical protein U5L96_07935 [Owenweeksia sp.]|nr:hypothetical protein [Owenweeksia sp.]